jgi:hypothetical protein
MAGMEGIPGFRRPSRTTGWMSSPDWVVHRDIGSQKVGPALITTTQIGAVTRAAMNPVQVVTSGDQCCVAGGRC